MEKSQSQEAAIRIAWVFVIALGFWLRLRSLHFYAFTADGCEYVSALRDGYLPHSPYVLYYWIGWLLHHFLPADIALSLLSLSAGLALPLLLGWLVSRMTGSRLASLSAATIYSISPVCVAGAGFVEVYPLQTALLLVTLALAAKGGARAALAASLVYGAAIATHTGSLFAFPAFLYLVLRAIRQNSRQASIGSIRWRLPVAAGALVLLVPALAAGWLALLFLKSSPSDPWREWLVYLRGIAPSPAITFSELVALPAAMVRTSFHMLDSTTGWRFIPGILLVMAVSACWRRHRTSLLLWLGFSAPYVIYESLLGEALDRGVYTVFIAPAVAGTLACGVEALFATPGVRSSRTLGLTCTAIIALLLVGPFVKSYDRGVGVLSRKEFFRQDLLQSARWMAQNLPRDSYLVLAPALENRRWLACYSRLRGMTYRRGAYRRFIGSAWSPLNARSFAPLSGSDLRLILEKGTAVMSVVPDLTIVNLANEGARQGRYQWRAITAQENEKHLTIYELTLTRF